MHHSVALITTIAAAFGLALILGFIAVRLKLPALVGYLVAGIIIGPATPGFVADVELSRQLAEIGVMLLMFGVGLHFSAGRPAGGSPDRAAGRCRSDRSGDRARRRPSRPSGAGASAQASCSAWRCPWRARWSCCGAGEPRRARIAQRPHRGRLAGGRRPRHGAGPRAAAAAVRMARRRRRTRRRRGSRRSAACSTTLAITLGEVAVFVGADAGRRAARFSRGCSGRWRAPARGSCSRCA